jgi:predicted alpha/beta hydrolase family esterase
MQQQVWVIHGGDTFDTYEEYLTNLKNITPTLDDLKHQDWKSKLGETLGEQYEVLAPRMPNGYNAKFVEWKIWFDKFVPFMQDHAILIGHSLGGIFLAKYLAEEAFPQPIRATFLIAAPYNATANESLADFNLPTSLDQFAQQSPRIFLYHSQDDPVVPFSDFKQYQTALPAAQARPFTDRQHFNQAEFPELAADIQALAH